MAFWNNSALDPADLPPGIQAQAQLGQAQFALAQSRRRLLGAAVLLLLACATIPWMLDSAPRSWGDDVILRMPKNEQPYQAKPSPKPSAFAAPSVPATPSNPTVKP